MGRRGSLVGWVAQDSALGPFTFGARRPTGERDWEAWFGSVNPDRGLTAPVLAHCRVVYPYLVTDWRRTGDSIPDRTEPAGLRFLTRVLIDTARQQLSETELFFLVTHIAHCFGCSRPTLHWTHSRFCLVCRSVPMIEHKIAALEDQLRTTSFADAARERTERHLQQERERLQRAHASQPLSPEEVAELQAALGAAAPEVGSADSRCAASSSALTAIDRQ